MSRQNKVNPGMYTQRGRLTQDDAARELAKQRSVGSEHTWQPVQRDQQPRVPSTHEAGGDDATAAEPDETIEDKPARVTAKAKPAQKTASRSKAKARAKTTARARTTGRAKKTAAPARKAKATSARTTKARPKSSKRRKS